MLDRETVTVDDAAKDGPQDGLVQIVNTLAAHADEVMVMLWFARDVRRDVATPLETPGHPALHLRFERPIHGREREARVSRSESLVELLG